jgi:L-ascorbate metabolism protein UlaG (beta-lactamase superfamily)
VEDSRRGKIATRGRNLEPHCGFFPRIAIIDRTNARACRGRDSNPCRTSAGPASAPRAASLSRLRLYITGDTLFRPEILGEIPERFADIDAALVHLGGTRILGVLLTIDGRDGVALSRSIRPRSILPIHYEDYPVMRDPPAGFLRLADGLPVRTLERGQTVGLAAAQGVV